MKQFVCVVDGTIFVDKVLGPFDTKKRRSLPASKAASTIQKRTKWTKWS